MPITLKSGGDAESLLKDTSFKKNWNGLLKKCRWATPYQSHGYASSWYEAYRPDYEPLLVFQLSQEEQLEGLLPLAIHKKCGAIEVAGAHQAEYQSWLADISCEEAFIQDAIEAVSQLFNPAEIKFKYVLGTAPLNWLHKKKWRKYCILKSTKRPLINFEEDTFSLKLLANKHFRNGLNRLKRQGEVTYSQIVDSELFVKVLPMFEVMYDFRMLATYGVAPFSEDPCKRPFHLALFNKENLLHVTVLHVGGQIVAFKVAIRDEKTLYGGVAAFSPLFARCKATKIFSFFLFQDLIERNFSCYDITPGRDAYKDRMANTNELVFEITLFKSSLRCNLSKIRLFLQEQIIQTLIKLGVKPADLWIITRSFGHNFVKGILFDLFKRIFPEVNLLYRVNAEKARHLPEYSTLKKDNLEDFWKSHPEISGGLFNNFLVNSQKNFHGGQHPYTAAAEDSFFFCGWLSESINPKYILMSLPEKLTEKKVVIIRDITVVGSDIPVGFIEQAISQMIRDAALIPGTEEVILVLPKKNNDLLLAIGRLKHGRPDLLEPMTS